MNPKFHYIEQRTKEWDELRRGKLTASCASKLVTPTGKASTQYRGEIARIIAERMGLQEPEFLKPTYWMERGINLEQQARNWFEVETNLDVHDIGFVSDEDELVGASPDGLIHEFTDRGGNDHWIPLELKCPKPSTHIQWLLEGTVPKDHVAQVHFQMALCAAPYAYFSSYNPEVAPLIVKVERGDYTELMENSIAQYKTEFVAAVAKIGGE